MRVVEISCEREPLIAERCRKLFEANFNKDLRRAFDAADWAHLERFRRVLAREAKRQGWYDYETLDEDELDWQGKPFRKKRRLLYNENGTHKLIVPEVRIVDGSA